MNLWNFIFLLMLFRCFILSPPLTFPSPPGGFWCLKILLKHEKLWWKLVGIELTPSLPYFNILLSTLKYVYFLRVLGRWASWASCTHPELSFFFPILWHKWKIVCIIFIRTTYASSGMRGILIIFLALPRKVSLLRFWTWIIKSKRRENYGDFLPCLMWKTTQEAETSASHTHVP